MGGGNPLKKIEREAKRAASDIGGRVSDLGKSAYSRAENIVKKSPAGALARGKNPIKEALSFATQDSLGTVADLAGSLGAEGLADTLDQTSSTLTALQEYGVDRVSGKYDKMKEEASAAQQRAAAEQAKAANEAKLKEAADEQARMEEERMRPGKRARTLLTGSMGIEDQYATVSRRKLSGR